MYTIGEFSRITGLSIKALRLYHDKGLVVPAYVDAGSGYRYYDTGSAEKAFVIAQLRELGFTLQQIGEIVSEHDDEGDILDHLEQQRLRILDQISRDSRTAKQLLTIIHKERTARTLMQQSTFEVEEKTVDDMLIAGIRMTGRYRDCGKGFGKLGRAVGRWACGRPFLLHYCDEYREEDADFETCFPIRKVCEANGISVRDLPGGRCVSLLHKGPYDELGRSYEKILDYLKQREWKTILPTREIYHKGPGMIFRGNPKKYLTEIQFFLDID